MSSNVRSFVDVNILVSNIMSYFEENNIWCTEIKFLGEILCIRLKDTKSYDALKDNKDFIKFLCRNCGLPRIKSIYQFNKLVAKYEIPKENVICYTREGIYGMYKGYYLGGKVDPTVLIEIDRVIFTSLLRDGFIVERDDISCFMLSNYCVMFRLSVEDTDTGIKCFQCMLNAFSGMSGVYIDSSIADTDGGSCIRIIVTGEAKI